MNTQYIKQILIQHATIYLEERVLEEASILLEQGIITGIWEKEIPEVSESTTVIDASNLHVIPGFIDAHIHGANGFDVMDATEEALEAISAFLPNEGVTSFLATTITQSPENIEKALMNAAAYRCKSHHAELLGVHLEGPFINKRKAGAQPEQYIEKPNLELFQRWQDIAKGKIKTITMAPELDQDGSFIRALVNDSVNVSAGHTDASFLEMKSAVSLGVRQLTHLCNAMNGIHHRDIGAVGAAFLISELQTEIIADGIHVSDDMLQIIYNNVGSDRIILITDAMRAKGLSPGNYDLGGQNVRVMDNRAVLEDGTLAGSIVNMRDAASRMLGLEGVTMRDIIKMTSTNVAKQLSIDDRKGIVAVGKDADLLLVDKNLNLHYTICRGQIAYIKEGL
ncbi:MAG TPA: N-acetylglucosamine-6-phosphate deacetylase [Ureibacillus sp.]|nr:N-acetylglucosamine-6-phosphate deacetylase [Ureibacillus sp.]